jgi:hypothetical protein
LPDHSVNIFGRNAGEVMKTEAEKTRERTAALVAAGGCHVIEKMTD